MDVQETIKYVKSLTSRKEKFRLISEQMNAPDLSLVADVSTRWNSTVNMLETAIKFRDAFVWLAECDGSYKFLPSDDDWKHVSSETDCLKVFYDVTKRTFDTKFRTVSFYFIDFCCIDHLLRRWKSINNSLVAAMAISMLQKK